MSKLLYQLEGDLTAAQKVQNEVKISVLRYLLSKIRNAQIAKGKDKPLQDSEIQVEILREVKQHKESIESFKTTRTDLAEKEKAELQILESYLPQQLKEVEISQIVSEAIKAVGASNPADFGKVMAVVMGKIAGKAEGAKVAEIVKSKLATQ